MVSIVLSVAWPFFLVVFNNLLASQRWNDHIWNCGYEIKWSYDPRSYERKFWTRDLAIPVWHSNQLSYEATEVGSWSFVGSNVPVRDESTMKWYMKWIIYGTAGFKPRWSPEFFRLLYAIAKIAFITARIIASLDFIYAAPYMIHLIYHFIVDSFLTETLEPTNDQWLHSSVG